MNQIFGRCLLPVSLSLLLVGGCATKDLDPGAQPPDGAADGVSASAAEIASESLPEASEAAPELPTDLGSAEKSFIARGQEPGWMLRMNGERLRLLAEYGAVELEADQPRPDVIDGIYRYSLEIDGKSLTIEVLEELCADIATGMPYPYRVRYQLDGQTRDGCGGATRDLLGEGMWHVVTVNGSALAGRQTVTLSLEEQGRIFGQGPCNRYTGTYRLTGERLIVSGVAATRMACPDADWAEAEQRFLQVLGAVQYLSMPEHGRLRLFTPDGGRLEAIRAP